jgi:hypothetical protein
VLFIYNRLGFIQSAQGLEIVSLIFYIVAGILIIIGIIDLERAPLELMFEAAAVLLFLSSKFIPIETKLVK